MYNFIIPKMGQGDIDIEIIDLKVKVGDIVKAGDAIVEVESEKVNTVLESEVEGIIKEIIYKNRISLDEKIQSIVESAPTKEFIEKAFSLIAPDAKSVYVIGDFNNWNADENDRLIHENGKWERKLCLKKGKYRYKFIVDGLWRPDPDNPRLEENSFGSLDSVMEVK